MHRFLTAAVTVALALSVAACPVPPEENSGEDAYRNVAAELAIGEWVVDNISSGDGDTTDWKFVMLAQPTAFVVELTADNPETEMKLGVYDRYGMQLGAGVRSEAKKTVKLKIGKTDRNGKHFVMVKALDGPTTDYQVRVKVGEGSSGGGDPSLPDF